MDTGLSSLVLPLLGNQIIQTKIVFTSPLLLIKGKRGTADGFMQVDPLVKTLTSFISLDLVSSTIKWG